MSALPGQFFIINKLNPYCLITASLQMSGSHTALQTPVEKTEVEMFTLQMHTGYTFGLWHFLLSNLQKVFTKACRTSQIHTEPRYQHKKNSNYLFLWKEGASTGMCFTVLLCAALHEAAFGCNFPFTISMLQLAIHAPQLLFTG